MRKMIYSPDALVPGEKKGETYVFLAGPIQGADDWRETVPDIPGVTWINPKRRDMAGFEWEKQVEWETRGLEVSDFLLFWIPPEAEHVDGRDYAQTTRIELMENLVRGKHVVFGADPSIHARRYMAWKYKRYAGKKILSTLAECLKELKKEIRACKEDVFFTSDTHFGSKRALELSKRPFKDADEMDREMILRWNSKVAPGSLVYHLGDFGDYSNLKYLNGNVVLIPGNYEEKEIQNDGFQVWSAKRTMDGFYKVYGYHEPASFEDMALGHEPLWLLESYPAEKHMLFGHIHGRQKVKRFGIDVGVDCNNFEPMSLDDVRFYMNALDKGYYDGNVFC